MQRLVTFTAIQSTLVQNENDYADLLVRHDGVVAGGIDRIHVDILDGIVDLEALEAELKRVLELHLQENSETGTRTDLKVLRAAFLVYAIDILHCPTDAMADYLGFSGRSSVWAALCRSRKLVTTDDAALLVVRSRAGQLPSASPND